MAYRQTDRYRHRDTHSSPPSPVRMGRNVIISFYTRGNGAPEKLTDSVQIMAFARA